MLVRSSAHGSSSSPSSAAPTPAAGSAAVEAPFWKVLTAELRRRDIRARIVVAELWGEPELRVAVRRAGCRVQAELMGPCASAPIPQYWCALRLNGDDRCAWRGPELSCPVEELVDFLVALVTGDDGALTGFRCLG